MNVSLCESPDKWDAFVASATGASNYHRWIWRQVMEETFGHRSYYLAAGNGAIDGVLPLVFIESRLFGNFLVSVPFFSHGGVVAASEAARTVLLKTAAQLAQELGARHLELRQDAEFQTDFIHTTPKITVEVPLPGTVRELWQRFSPKLRKRIRAGRKHGLRAEWGGEYALAAFYQVFATNMRNLGTPVYPRDWFANIRRHQPATTELLILRNEQQPVAAAFLIRNGDTMELPWAASTPEARRIFSPLVLYCSLLEHAIETGCRSVDLGRCTPGSGNHRFKQHWGTRERQLHWYYWLAPGAALPALRPNNLRYRLAARLWKHMPLAVANCLGPWIVRSLP
jgi:serine/alanine adding enzyme